MMKYLAGLETSRTKQYKGVHEPDICNPTIELYTVKEGGEASDSKNSMIPSTDVPTTRCRWEVPKENNNT